MSYVFQDIAFTKTYASKINAMKAVTKVLGQPGLPAAGSKAYVFRVSIMPTADGRFSPLIYGTNEKDGGLQAAIQSGFNVVC